VLIRWGGDEFLLVGRDTDPVQVGALAERIRSEIEAATFEIGEGRVVRTTCSIGFTCYPFLHDDPEAHPWEDVLALADGALYAAKSRRNAWVGFLSTPQAPNPGRAIIGEPQRMVASGLLRVLASDPALAQDPGFGDAPPAADRERPVERLETPTHHDRAPDLRWMPAVS
jgi:hypothetical protein